MRKIASLMNIFSALNRRRSSTIPINTAPPVGRSWVESWLKKSLILSRFMIGAANVFNLRRRQYGTASRTASVMLCHGQRAVKRRQADDFRAGDMRAMFHALGRMKQGAGGVGHVGFLPFTGKDVSPFVRVRMRMCRNDVPGLELAQHDDSAGVGMLVQHHQLDASVRATLPGFIPGQGDVGKHKLDVPTFDLFCRDPVYDRLGGCFASGLDRKSTR